jgi:transcriptional regulator GlxA family with amidase domain
MLLFPGFPMMAFSSVVEPLRAANALGAEPQYSWITVSATDKPITASNGITFTPDFRLTERPPADFMVVS